MLARRERLGPWVAMLALVLAAAQGGVRAQEAAAVHLAVEAAVNEGTLVVQGRAALPDGAWVEYAAYRKADPTVRARGAVRVERGRFEARADVADWRPGAVMVDVQFSTRARGEHEQPEQVLRRYGRKGERIHGPNVVVDGAGYRVVVASDMAFK